MVFKDILRALVSIKLMIILVFSFAHAAEVNTDLANLKIGADHSSVAPGDDFHIVIELTPIEGWHGYWENPGDAGLKLTMDWNDVPGIEIGELQFTSPHLIPFEEIVSYGYDGKITIIAEAQIEDDFSGSMAEIGGAAFWLVCSDALCVPQDAEISFELPVGETVIDKFQQATVNAAKDDMPVSVDWETAFHTDGENFTVKAEIPEEYNVIESAYLFPHSEGMIENVYYQDISFVNQEIIGRFKNAYGYEDNEQFNYVLSLKTGEGEELAFALSATKSAEPVASVLNAASAEPAGAPIAPDISLATALLFAFIGGVILNLMPCVFPILSLKVMSVTKLGEKSVGEARKNGLIYTAGILVSFAAIGILVTSLSVGWGFHMQLPLVNFGLGLLMVLIALNLFGIFEVTGRFAGVGQGLINQEEDASSGKNTFFTGVLAVVVATPCTAPFMASALGFAFISGGVTGLLVFLALGFGLAFPYLLICYVPAFRSILPKPGAWMESMRNILGFPMLATALWLFWIMGNQVGVNGMTIAIAASMALAMAIWAISKQGMAWKLLSAISIGLVFFSGYLISQQNITISGEISTASDGGLNAEPFSSEALAQQIGQNKAVFVYFTADWCVTCKLNERVALSQTSVHQAFSDKNITVMVGDWTNQNPDITRTLQKYGRIGVPLYLYFPEGRSIDNPVILPQILTPESVIQAL